MDHKAFSWKRITKTFSDLHALKSPHCRQFFKLTLKSCQMTNGWQFFGVQMSSSGEWGICYYIMFYVGPSWMMVMMIAATLSSQKMEILEGCSFVTAINPMWSEIKYFSLAVKITINLQRSSSHDLEERRRRRPGVIKPKFDAAWSFQKRKKKDLGKNAAACKMAKFVLSVTTVFVQPVYGKSSPFFASQDDKKNDGDAARRIIYLCLGPAWMASARRTET